MATPVTFPESDGIEDVAPPATPRPLPVKRFPRSTVSCWKLDKEELSEVAQTSVIWVSTRTFGELDPPPVGERWQPELSVSAISAIALDGWNEPSEAPASDRIVTFRDNQSGIEDIRNDLSDLENKLKFGNDLGNFSRDEADEAARELFILQQMLAAEGCRVDWVLPTAKRTLTWIATKSGEGAIQTAAVLVLAKIWAILTQS